jgi:hypothetical protein
MNEGISFLLMILIGCVALAGLYFLFISYSNQPIHINSNQTIVHIGGNNWERIAINRTDLASFKNLTKNGIWFISSCHLYFFVSNDYNFSNGDGNVSSIIEFPNTIYSTSPFDCLSAIWNGGEKLNINRKNAYYIIEKYNDELGVNLTLSG